MIFCLLCKLRLFFLFLLYIKIFIFFEVENDGVIVFECNLIIDLKLLFKMFVICLVIVYLL